MARANTTLALKAAVLALLVVSSAVWADGQVTSHKARSTAATQASLAEAQQKLQQQQAQVKQLQDSVAKQESGSKQASERLQQQDHAIADLQKQLDALHAKPPAKQH